MKALNFKRVVLVCSLLLGLIIGWASAAPKGFSGEIMRGSGCCDCSGICPTPCNKIFSDSSCPVNEVPRCVSGSTGDCGYDGSYDCGTSCGTAHKQTCPGNQEC